MFSDEIGEAESDRRQGIGLGVRFGGFLCAHHRPQLTDLTTFSQLSRDHYY